MSLTTTPCRCALGLALLFSIASAQAQISIPSAGVPIVEGFDGFQGEGFAPSPAPGQLDSDHFAVAGMSDGDLPFGGTATSGDFARGVSTGGVVSGGVYAYDDGADQWLFVQPAGSDFTPGTLTLRYRNDTGATITAIDLAYDIRVFNDQARATFWNTGYSTDGADFTALSALDYTSPEGADAEPAWETVPRSTTIPDLSINPGEYLYLRFRSDDVSGEGSRDEIGVDNIALTAITGPPSGTPVVSFTATSASAPEGEAVTLTVEIGYPNDAPDGNPVTVAVDFDAAGTADAADFAGPTPASVTFSGTTDNEQLSVEVTLVEDGLVEGNETAFFDLVITSGEADLGTPATFVLTIVDLDSDPPARVQLIHNAADPAAALVDIAIADVSEGGEEVLLDDVAFRAATPFFDLAPATYQVTVTDSEDAGIVIIQQEVTVVTGGTYQLIPSGVADPAGFAPNPDGRDIEATLLVNADAQEANVDDFNVAVNAVHGTTDAPTVDVREVGAVLVDDAAYGDITPYLVTPPGSYTLDVTTADGETAVATFIADLGDMEGDALTVLASGFLDPSANQDGEAFGLLAVLADGSTFLLPQVIAVDIATARALPNGSLVHVEGVVTRAMGAFTYMQDETAGIVIRQTAGPFFDAVADGTITPGTELRVTGLTSEFNQLKQINAGDLRSFEILGEADVPAPQAITLAGLVANGEAYEAELVRVGNLDIAGSGTFAAATSYDVSDPTATLAAGLRIPNAADSELDGEPIPEALATFTGVVGQFSFEDPAAGYQLMGIEATDIESQPSTTALLQVVHNAPDPAFGLVDVYLNGDLLLDDFAFRTATAYEPVPAGLALEVAVAPGDSESAADAVFAESYTLDVGGTYQLVAAGVGEPGDFVPNPDGIPTAFTLLVNADAKQTSAGVAFVDANAVHGTPDAPAVDILESTSGIALISDVAYTDVTGYATIPVGTYTLDVTPAGEHTTVLASFEANLSGYSGEAITVLASGFLDPGANQNGPAFGVLIVAPDGEAVFLEPLGTSGEDGAALPTAFVLDGHYPNPLTSTTTLRYDLPDDAEVSVAVFDVLGREVLRRTPEAVAAGAARSLILDATALPPGTYLYRLTAETPGTTVSATGRMTVVR